MRRWISERVDWDLARTLWDDPSLTVVQIGQRVGASQQLLSHRAKELGWPRRRFGGAKRVDWAVARAYWDDGMTGREISARLGCSISAVHNHAAEAGWPRRVGDEPRWIEKKAVKLAGRASGTDWHQWAMDQPYPGRGYLELNRDERDIVCAVARFMAGVPQQHGGYEQPSQRGVGRPHGATSMNQRAAA